MHAKSSPDQPHLDTRTTGFLAAAVVVVLGGLALFLLGCNQFYGIQETRVAVPNYYTCRIECASGFGVGARVQTTVNGPITASPGGAFVNPDKPAGSQGAIIEGPGSPAGSSEIWWRVRFDDNETGWAPQTRLEVIGGTGVVLQDKELDACVPADFDPVNAQMHCEDTVLPAFRVHHASELPPGTGCTATALTTPSKEDESCNAPCADPTGVCVRMGWDPDPPVPDPLAVAVFAPMTTCEVTGTATLNVGGHAPKDQPGARGIVRILGRPCPGETCQLGVGFALTGDNIEFDSGTIFASDPAFGDLSVRGVTEPAGVTVGPFLGCTDCSFGALEAGSVLTTIQGRRLSLVPNPPRVLNFINTQAVALAVNWEQKTCRIAGDLGGQAGGVVDDNGDTLVVSADVALDGILVNQPPVPDGSRTRTTVECTVPGATPVTLDGSASTDPDGNIAFYVWRQGSETGPHVGEPSLSPVTTTTQALGQPTTYDLRVVDARFAADHTPVTVSVVDTTAPTILCNAPATITPSDVPEKRDEGISFKATATDACSGVSQVAITNFSCTKPRSCRVTVQGDTLTILDSGGVGDVISWTVSATDASGNLAQKTCQLNVVKK